MGHRVRGPEIAGIEFDGAPPGGLGSAIVAGFLMGEAMAREYRRVAWNVVRPSREHALDRAHHVVRTAEPEVDEMGETEGDHVERIGAQNRFPQGDGAIELAVGPGGQGCDVIALARRSAGGARLGSARRLESGRNAGLLIGQHGEIALHAVSKREIRIGFEQGGETVRRIRPLREVSDDEVVVGSGRLGASGRDGQAAGIEIHRFGPPATVRVRLTVRLGHNRRSSEVCLGHGCHRVDSAGVAEPAHCDVQILYDRSRIDDVFRTQFDALGRMGVTEQCEVEASIQGPVRRRSNAPVRGRTCQENARDLLSIQDGKQVCIFEGRVEALMDPRFSIRWLKFWHPLPFGRSPLQLLVVVLDPHHGNTGCPSAPNCEGHIANDPLALPCRRDYADLDIDDKENGSSTGASCH